MIEVIAAVLLFVGTFLGVFSLNKIQDDFQTGLDNRLKDQKKEMDSLEKKLARNQKALKYTPQIFVVRNLVFDEEKESRVEFWNKILL